MNPTDAADSTSTAASRLCAECGLCCNGVMFHKAMLQPGEKPGQLAALGLRIMRKKGGHYLAQPCAAHTGTRCSVYEGRPLRCRIFACRQLRRAMAGEITEAAALEKIRDARQRVAEIEALLHEAGPTDVKRPLSLRCEKIAAVPPDPADHAAVELRRRLAQEFLELDALLDADFRVPPEEKCGGE
ncbi:MAG TPA: YkgJ family cysteine cluster protein [Chthoniobacteraceae bacterium]|nr:YkgJ family cysteine cluster protein [Chthoniobacteraceae bacterium]